MKLNVTKKRILISLLSIAVIAACFVIYAYQRIRNKTDIEFKIHINEKLVKESTFGESPTFAIWLENPQTGLTQTVFVTNRAGKDDWEGKAAVPVALPKWFEVNEKGKLAKNQLGSKTIPDHDAITGATPKPGYFSTRFRVATGSKWICWIEVNLAGDFNDTFKEYDEVAKLSDDYKTGQPALLYKAQIEASNDNMVIPEIVGMCLLDSLGKVVVKPPKGINLSSK